MEIPLDIIEGQDGSLQDIYGRPMIMVFNLKVHTQARAEKPEYTNAADKKDTGIQPLAFIPNATISKERDESARKLIRSHVMKNYKRQEKNAYMARKSRSRSIRQKPHNPDVIFAPPPTVNRQPSGSLDPFVSYPVPMRPHMYRLVHHYLSVMIHAMYPSEPNFFPMALSDAALFHMLLCNSALYMDVLSANAESPVGVLHKLEAIGQIKLCLQAGPAVSDALIGAVACLAKVESILGNHELWEIHRNGMIKMVEVRGGIKTLNAYLQAKVCIADLVGCLEADSSPYFPFFDGSDFQHPSKGRPMWDLGGFKAIASSFSINPGNIASLKDLHAFTEMITLPSTARDSPDIDRIAANIRHRLLSCSSARTNATQKDVINEACRIGCLLYLKTILRTYPSRSRNPHLLIENLIWCIDNLEDVLFTKNKGVAELIVWLLLVGGIADFTKSGRLWFTDRLSKFASCLQLSNWENVKSVLKKFLWADSVHEIRFQALWGELLAPRTTTPNSKGTNM